MSDPMPEPPLDRGSDERRASIHLAALQRFVAEGFAGARLKDIAADAGLGSAAHLYYYAPRKEDLFLEVVRTYALLPDDLFTERDDDGDARSVLERFMRDYLDAFSEQRRLLAFALLNAEARRLATGGAEQTVFNLAVTVGRLEAWFAARVADGSLRAIDPRRAVHTMLGSLNYYVLNRPDGEPTAAINEAIARDVADLLWRGLSP